MREEERYTGAWATPDLIGRTAILDQIDRELSNRSQPSIIALYGPGGIGKTRILNDTLKRSKAGVVLARQAVDLYDIQYHSSLALATAIYKSLPLTADDAFRTFKRERERQSKAQNSGDVRQIVAATQEALQSFISDFNRFSQSQPVVIALDTLERVAYGASEQRPPFQVATSWQWLVDTLPAWGNVTVLVAGRNQIRHLFNELEQHQQLHLAKIEVGPFTRAEADDYLDAVARVAEQSGEQAVADTLRSLTPQRREQIYRCSGGSPILLALLADYISIAGFGQLPGILDIETDPEQAREQLEQQMVDRMMNAEGIRDTLQMLGRAPKGVNESLLAHVLEIPVDEVRRHLDAIKRLSFIKVRNDRYFLHDEMYAILERQIYNAPEDAPEADRVSKAIIEWYQSQINTCSEQLKALYTVFEQEERSASGEPEFDYVHVDEVRREVHRLQSDQMFYRLRSDQIEGIRQFFQLLFSDIFVKNTEFVVQAQAELVLFFNEKEVAGKLNDDSTSDTSDVLATIFGDEELLQGMIRIFKLINQHVDKNAAELFQGMLAVYMLTNLYARDQYTEVIKYAQKLRREGQNLLQTGYGSTEAAVNIWEALARLGRASKEEKDLEYADQFLDAAERYLDAIMKSNNMPTALYWRAQSLQAPAYHARGFGLRIRGQIGPAIAAYRRAVKVERQIDVPVLLAWTLNNLGFVESENGNFSIGRSLVEESLEIRKRLGVPSHVGLSYATLSLILTQAGEYEQAKRNAERALRLYRAVDYPLGQGLALRNLSTALRRSITYDDNPSRRKAILEQAIEHARAAHQIFEEIGDRPRQMEALGEIGRALRDMIAMKQEFSFEESELNRVLQECLQTQKQVVDLARQTNNVFYQVDAWVNIAYVGSSGDQSDLIEEGLTAVRREIHDDYLIKRHSLPDLNNPNIQNRQLFTQIARIHMLIGNRLFAHYARLTQQANKSVNEVFQEYKRFAVSFVDELPTGFRGSEDCLHYAVYHYALAFENDRLYNPNHSAGLRAQNSVYNRLKTLNAKELETVAQAIRSFESEYSIGESALRNLLESRALLIE